MNGKTVIYVIEWRDVKIVTSTTIRFLPHEVMDAEHLIALLTEIEPQNKQPRQADLSLEDPLHDGLRVVLDAIANVLISRAQGEVIAVGMQQQSGPKKKMFFTLASNRAIMGRTLEHARKLVRAAETRWRLCQFSQGY